MKLRIITKKRFVVYSRDRLRTADPAREFSARGASRASSFELCPVGLRAARPLPTPGL